MTVPYTLSHYFVRVPTLSIPSGASSGVTLIRFGMCVKGKRFATTHAAPHGANRVSDCSVLVVARVDPTKPRHNKRRRARFYYAYVESGEWDAAVGPSGGRKGWLAPG